MTPCGRGLNGYWFPKPMVRSLLADEQVAPTRPGRYLGAARMNWFKSGDLLDRAFAIGIILKGLDGVLEVVGGVALLIISPTTIDNLSRALTQHELSQDPHDFLATHLLHATGSLTGSSLEFGAAYLGLHGVVKVILVAALLRDQIWAYPWMIVFLIVFIVYQVYRMTFAFSIGLLG